MKLICRKAFIQFYFVWNMNPHNSCMTIIKQLLHWKIRFPTSVRNNMLDVGSPKLWLLACRLKMHFRSSHRKYSVNKGALRNFTKFTGKQLCLSLFFNKVAGLRPGPATLEKKRLWHRCFPVNVAKFLRTPFLQNTSGDCFWYLCCE